MSILTKIFQFDADPDPTIDSDAELVSIVPITYQYYILFSIHIFDYTYGTVIDFETYHAVFDNSTYA
jgi:hypothetical protein